jgi:hypothetical protein
MNIAECPAFQSLVNSRSSYMSIEGLGQFNALAVSKAVATVHAINALTLMAQSARPLI